MAWCGFIATRGLLESPPRDVPGAVVVVLAAEEGEIVVEVREAASSDIVSPFSCVSGCGMPVSAVQISAIGGSASV